MNYDGLPLFSDHPIAFPVTNTGEWPWLPVLRKHAAAREAARSTPAHERHRAPAED